jgi:hypothetical protein
VAREQNSKQQSPSSEGAGLGGRVMMMVCGHVPTVLRSQVCRGPRLVQELVLNLRLNRGQPLFRTFSFLPVRIDLGFELCNSLLCCAKLM